MSVLSAFFPWHWTAGFYAGSLLLGLFRKERPAWVLLGLGLVANTLFLVGRSEHSGIFVPVNLVTETYFLPWCLAGLTGILAFFEKHRQAAFNGIYLVLFFSLTALLVPVDARVL